MLEAAIFIVFPFCMAFAAISDMLSMTIANRVSIILVVAFAVIAPLVGMTWSEFGMHFAAAGIVLAVTFTLFAVGGMGGGDAKLLAATSIWFGLHIELVQYLVFTAFIGGILTIAILGFRKSPKRRTIPASRRESADRATRSSSSMSTKVACTVSFSDSRSSPWTPRRIATSTA